MKRTEIDDIRGRLSSISKMTSRYFSVRMAGETAQDFPVPNRFTAVKNWGDKGCEREIGTLPPKRGYDWTTHEERTKAVIADIEAAAERRAREDGFESVSARCRGRREPRTTPTSPRM